MTDIERIVILRKALFDIEQGNCGNLIDVAKDATSQAEAQRLFHMAFTNWMQKTARAALDATRQS